MLTKTIFDFIFRMTIFTLIFWACIAFLMTKIEIHFESFLYAWLVIITNSAVGYLAFEYAYSVPSRDFNKVALGGQIIRLVISLIAILILILSNFVVKSQFVIALVGFYVLYTAIEVSAYQKKINLEKTKE